MNTENMSPEESLHVINSMIGKAKKRYQAMNAFFLIWGTVIFLAGLSFYGLAVYTDVKHPYLAWFVFSGIGGVMSFIVGKRLSKKQAPSYIDKFINVIWLSFGGALFIVIFLNIYNRYPPDIDIMIITGIATLCTGYIINFAPLIIGGILFWCFAIATSMFFLEYAPVMTSIAVLFGYIIPGLMLKQKEKQLA